MQLVQTPRLVVAAAWMALIVFPLDGLTAQVGTFSDHQFGGFVNAVWLERVPISGGQPDAFLVWTAEDGRRIRVYNSVTDTITDQPIVTGTPQTLHDIYVDQFVEKNGENLYGVAVGTGGEALWWESDGHTQWRRFVTEPAPNMELWACAVEHESTGTKTWVAGQSHTLRSSTDRGHTWSDAIWVTSPAAGATFTAMDFADWSLTGTHGIVGTNTGELFFTIDGTTWDKGTIHGLPTPALPLILWDIDFRPGSATEAFAVGGRVEGNGEGFAWRTTDGGQNWFRVLTELELTGMTPTPTSQLQPGNACSATPGLKGGTFTQKLYSTLYGCHAKTNGEAIFCAYGGQVWSYLPALGAARDILDNYQFTRGPLWGCHGDGDQEIWLSGQFGILRRTSDGGTTWQAKTPNETWRLRDLAFPSSAIGYAVGQSLRVAKTTDGGETWTEQIAYRSGVNLGPGFEAVAAYDDTRVVAIANGFNGADPIVFRTQDGGQTCWQAVDLSTVVPQPAPSLLDVAAGGLDPVTQQPTFWVCGATTDAGWPGLMKSINGGQNWVAVPALGSDFTWHGVAALGTTTVVIVGRRISTNKMAAYLTLDANNSSPTWQDILVNGPSGTLHGVALNGAALLAVGTGGRVFEWDNGTGTLVTSVGSAGVTSRTLQEVAIGFDGTVVWAYVCGDVGTVLRSPLGSGMWETLNSNTTDNLTAVGLRVAPGDIDGWIVGTNARWGDSTILHLR